MTIHHDITINIGNNEATKKFLIILASLLEDPKGIIKQQIIDKLDKLIVDVKSTM